MKISTSHPLFKSSNYTAPINYVISSFIREYDISKANINVLFKKKVISKEEYDRLFMADRLERQVTIGLLQKNNPKISEILKEGIMEAKYLFLDANNIEENEILSIKNDAIFLINKIPPIRKFDNIEFVCKGTYTSFYKLDNGRVEIYYSYDMVSGNENIEVKGISDRNLELHKDHFLDLLMTLFYSAQTDTIAGTLSLLMDIYESYITLNLNVGYYRSFNSDSKYQLKQLGVASTYKAQFLSDDNKEYLEISNNLNILRELGSIYSSIQSKNNKR